MPSAAALHFKDDVGGKLRRSHLVFESPNLGLFMRYLLEKDYTTDIDFCNDITIKEGELSQTWFFNDMQKWRNQERDDFSNGVLRSTFKVDMFELEENTFSSNIWHSKIAVVSNMGIVLFNKNNVKEKPEIVPFGASFTMQVKNQNQVVDDKRNLIAIGFNDEEKMYSVSKRDQMIQLRDKTKAMAAEMKASKNPLVGYPKNN
mgnify:FL=1